MKVLDFHLQAPMVAWCAIHTDASAQAWDRLRPIWRSKRYVELSRQPRQPEVQSTLSPSE